MPSGRMFVFHILYYGVYAIAFYILLHFLLYMFYLEMSALG